MLPTFLAALLGLFTTPDPTPITSQSPAVQLENAAPAQPLKCEVRQSKGGKQHKVTAIVQATVGLDGEFTFTLNKTDAHHNTVTSSQGDQLSLKANESKVLIGPQMSIGKGDALTGRLEIVDSAGQPLTSCSL